MSAEDPYPRKPPRRWWLSMALASGLLVAALLALALLAPVAARFYKEWRRRQRPNLPPVSVAPVSPAAPPNSPQPPAPPPPRLLAPTGSFGPTVKELPGLSTPEEILELFRTGAGRDYSEKTRKLRMAVGPLRAAVWKAVIAGLQDGTERTRARAAWMAGSLTGKPDGRDLGPVDTAAIPLLMACLDSKNPKLVESALHGLGGLHRHDRSQGVSNMVRGDLERLLASEDPEMARAALCAVPSLGDAELAPDVIAAWEQHAGSGTFTPNAVWVLGSLATVRIKNDEQTAYPMAAKIEHWRVAKTEVKRLKKEFGEDPAKWKAWWKDQLELIGGR